MKRFFKKSALILSSIFVVTFAISKVTSAQADIKTWLNNELSRLIQDKTKNLEPIQIKFDYWPSHISKKTFNPFDFDSKKVHLEVIGDMFRAKILIGKKGKKITLTGSIVHMQNVPVLKKIHRGVIEADDITFMRFPIDKLPKNIALDVGDLVGKMTLISLRPQQPIRKNQLKTPMAVKRGQSVDVEYVSKNLLISTRATAKKNAAIGDEVTLEVVSHGKNNKILKKIIYARVTGEGRAKVMHA